jgi:hypothetical protein
MTLAKLRGARERKRRKTGCKVAGRKSYAEANPQLVDLARKLSEQRPRLSLREILTEQPRPLTSTPLRRRMPLSETETAAGGFFIER